MILYALWEAIVLAWWFWTKIFPGIVRVAIIPIKFSLLHITTLFKGWKHVAEMQAAQELGYGIKIGKYPQNPPQRTIDWLLKKANLRISAGAAINIYVSLLLFFSLMS
jgi:hypothetical protein